MADFSAVVGKFPHYPAIDPVWLCHKESLGQLDARAADGRRRGSPRRTSRRAWKPQFMGYPVEFVNVDAAGRRA
jgi:hypothetical protein